jgi:hypothetical protein
VGGIDGKVRAKGRTFRRCNVKAVHRRSPGRNTKEETIRDIQGAFQESGTSNSHEWRRHNNGVLFPM